jgi:hypothetical protein
MRYWPDIIDAGIYIEPCPKDLETYDQTTKVEDTIPTIAPSRIAHKWRLLASLSVGKECVKQFSRLSNHIGKNHWRKWSHVQYVKGQTATGRD